MLIRSLAWAFTLCAVIGPAAVHASERCPGGVIALTFDDGPVPSTSELLDVLKREGLRGTFFLVGENVERYPDLARRIVAEGHAIAGHSHTHADLTMRTAIEIQGELRRSRQAIREVTGVEVEFVRLPYVESNDEVSRSLSAAELIEVIWTVDSHDWKGASATDILRTVRATQSRGVVLMHDAAPHVRDALPLIAEYLRGNRICAGKLERTTERMPVSNWDPRAFYVRATQW
jgi:peptidoglycan/xylan/chitin deacetylase (PgdA/CDA1 family)